MSLYPKLDAFKARCSARYGAKCDFSELDATDCTIKEAYESGARMNYNYSPSGCPEDFPARGYVGITTGWRPAFIRLHNKRSMGGSDILTEYTAMGYSNPRRPKYRSNSGKLLSN